MKMNNVQALLFSNYRNRIKDVSQNSLWVLDESSESISKALLGDDVAIISNRQDIVSEHPTERAFLSDFNFQVISKAVHCVYFRVAKEKALVQHVINQAYKLLPLNGQLILAGEKNEGIKSYAQKAKDLFGHGSIDKQKTGYLVILTKTQTDSENFLDDQNYTQYEIVHQAGDIPCFSKPGVFGWNKVDQGSELLIEAVKELLENDNYAERIKKVKTLDLGCGWGYLSLEISALGFEHIYATDNNITAVNALEKTCTENKITHIHTWVDDCAKNCQEKFDLILCNPPFHQGFDHVYDLTEKFVSTAKQLTKKGGKALFVVNQFLPLEQKSKNLFSNCTVLKHANGFKVFELSNGNSD